MQEYITEILDEINNNPSTLDKYRYMSSVDAILKYAFDKNLKMKLRDGEPSFIPSEEPLGFCPSSLKDEFKRFYIFLNETISEERREILFIQMLEKIHPSEATILVAIKDQKLTSLFSNITPELVVEYKVVEEKDVVTSTGLVDEYTDNTLIISPYREFPESLDVGVIPEALANPSFYDETVEYTTPKPSGGIIENISTSDEIGIVLNPTPVEETEVVEVVEEVKPKRGRRKK